MNKVVLRFSGIVLLLLSALKAGVLYADTSSSCLDLQHNLDFGATDSNARDDVVRLQTFLISQGFLKTAVTGNFGKDTLLAVQEFQLLKGVCRDFDPGFGRVGPLTRAMIKEVSCEQAANQNVADLVSKSSVPVIPRPVNGAIAPVISEYFPQNLSAGEQITLKGSGFSEKYSIFFDSVFIETQISSIPSPQQALFTIPEFLGRPCPENMFCINISEPVRAGVHTLMLKNINGESNLIYIAVTGE